MPLNTKSVTDISEAWIIRTKIHPNFVQIKQNVRLIHNGVNGEAHNCVNNDCANYRLPTRLCEKKVFFKWFDFQKKGFCNKKKGFPCQMDSFLIPAKGFFTSCILK